MSIIEMDHPKIASRLEIDSAEKTKKQSSKSKKSMRSKELGRRGEDAAVRFLYGRGYEIIERNWTCFAGEADIIAKDGDCLVFAEVKTRSDCQKGFPSEAVDKLKREKYEKIALAYLADNDFLDMSIRFDVVSIVVVSPDRALIRHHINAFSAA